MPNVATFPRRGGLVAPVFGILFGANVLANQTQADAASPPLDLIQDEPTYLQTILSTTTASLNWAWNTVYDYTLDWLTPPSAYEVTGNVTEKDAVILFKVLGDAGYKLKEIDSQIGIIPTLAFKFAQVRELSEADFDHLETLVEKWNQENPGMYSALQRTIVDTVISVNLSTDYQVTELKVKLLPLPTVAFSVGPKETALGEESSALMNAIQRVDRTVRGIRRDMQDR